MLHNNIYKTKLEGPASRCQYDCRLVPLAAVRGQSLQHLELPAIRRVPAQVFNY